LNFLFFIFFVMGQSINDAHHPKKKKKTWTLGLSTTN
jgi:hypothetical protein